MPSRPVEQVSILRGSVLCDIKTKETHTLTPATKSNHKKQEAWFSQTQASSG